MYTLRSAGARDLGHCVSIDIALLWSGRVDTQNCPLSKCEGYFLKVAYRTHVNRHSADRTGDESRVYRSVSRL